MFALVPGLKSAIMAGLSAVAISAEPVPERSVADWADQDRIVSRIESNKPGPWSNDRFPVAVEIMEACSLSDPSVIIPIRGSAQSIKSEIAKNTIGSFIQDNPRGILVILPSNEELTKYERTKLDPMLRACPGLARRVHGIGNTASKKKTTVKLKEFRDGTITLTTAGSSKGLQMITVGLIVFEEIAEAPADTDGRGHALDQAIERGTQYEGELKVIVPSTPGMAGETEDGKPLCKITELFQDGDQRWIFWKCPHCADHFRMRFHHMAETEGRAVMFAPCCGTQIEHSEKRAMNQTPRLGGDCRFVPCFKSKNPANQVPWKIGADDKVMEDVIAAEDFDAAVTRDTEGRDKSFHIWRGQSPFSSWSAIWKKWIKVKDDPIALKPFYQQYLGEPFEPALDKPKHEAIFEMRGGAPDAKTRPIRRGFIPPWAGFVVMVADLQGDRIEWAAKAYGPNGMIATIDHGIIDHAPFTPEAWTELRRTFNREWPSTHLRPQRAVKMGVDTGGHNTQDAYRFILGNPDVHGIKGMTGPQAQHEPLFQASRKGGKLKGLRKRTEQRVPLTLLNTHQLKKVVFFGLQNALRSHAEGQLQSGVNFFYHEEIDSGFAKQLVAENFIKDDIKRKEEWVRIASRPNEQLDLEVYGYALALMYGLNRMTESDWTALFTREAIDPTEIDLTPLEKLARVQSEPETPDRPVRPDQRPSWMKKLANYPGNQS